jgi:hypothetical protein
MVVASYDATPMGLGERRVRLLQDETSKKRCEDSKRCRRVRSLTFRSVNDELINVLCLVSVSFQVTVILPGRMWPDSSHTLYGAWIIWLPSRSDFRSGAYTSPRR